jgi:hypothetical protein
MIRRVGGGIAIVLCCTAVFAAPEEGVVEPTDQWPVAQTRLTPAPWEFDSSAMHAIFCDAARLGLEAPAPASSLLIGLDCLQWPMLSDAGGEIVPRLDLDFSSLLSSPPGCHRLADFGAELGRLWLTATEAADVMVFGPEDEGRESPRETRASEAEEPVSEAVETVRASTVFSIVPEPASMTTLLTGFSAVVRRSQ